MPRNLEYSNDSPQVAVEEVELPIPGPGQVLVKMVAAAVNPSDEGDLRQAAKHLPEGLKLPKVFGLNKLGLKKNTIASKLLHRVLWKTLLIPLNM